MHSLSAAAQHKTPNMGNTLCTTEDPIVTEPRTGVCWKMTGVGSPANPSLLKEQTRPVPTVGDKQVLVQVAAAALNPIDYKLATGKIAVVATPPFVAGFDFAGTVVAAGAKSGFEPGQQVFGDVPNRKEADLLGGSLSSYILVPSDVIALKPTEVSMTDASAISLVGQTVLDCLAKAAPTDGARVLILGASGGVGTTAVQICKAQGLHVIGVCSGRNRALVEELGADRVIDYTTVEWSEALAADKVDVVFDFAPSGPSSVASWDNAKKVLVKGGCFVTISGDDPEGKVTVGSFLGGAIGSAVNNIFGSFNRYSVLKKAHSSKLQQLSTLMQAGQLRAVVERVYEWSEVHEAFEKLMSGRAQGKLVVKAKSS